MKKFILFSIPNFRFSFFIQALLVSHFIFAQNVGIGTITPSRGKLEVFGVAGAGATSAIFGSDGTGISLQRNWPTIGFNQYRDIVTPGSQGKYMANGFAAIQYYDPTTGAMAFDMFPNGIANAFTPVANRAITILATGNVGIRTGASNTTSLYVVKGTNFDGAAIFGGTQYGSYFNYSNSEDTYIRPGKDGGTVIVNDVPNGQITLGARTTIAKSLVYDRKEVVINANNVVVSPRDTSYLYFYSNDAPSNRRVLITGNGAAIGQILIIQAASSPINNSYGIRLIEYTVDIVSKLNMTASSHDLLDWDTIMFIWDGTFWQQISYSVN